MANRNLLMLPELALLAYKGKKTETRRTGKRYANWRAGDTIWIREPWAVHPFCDSLKIPATGLSSLIIYHHPKLDGLRKRSALSMPKWAARTHAVITSVHQERLKEITEAGAIAEGFESRKEFAELWDEIKTTPETQWDANPMVWVVKFELLRLSLD